jgi:O-antigen/teichoic acid export membrane protein
MAAQIYALAFFEFRVLPHIWRLSSPDAGGSTMSSDQVARDSASGSLVLVLGNFLSTAFAAAGTIIVTRLLGPEGYGAYTLAFVAPSIFLQFLGFGVTLAVTRYSAFYLSTGEVDRAVQITRRGVTFLLLFGAALALLNYVAAPYVESVLLNRANLAPYTELTSIFILAQAATWASGYALVGWSSIKQLSIFQILQALVRLAISPPLILFGLGVYGAVLGQVASYAVEGGAAMLALYALKLNRSTETGIGFLEDVRKMVGFGVPAFAGGIASGLASQFVTIILALVATNAVVGEYQAAINISIAISLVSNSITTVLLRSFAALDGLKADVGPAFDYAVRYLSYLLTPVVIFLLGSATLLFEILYSSFYSGGAVFLQLTALSYLPVAFGLTLIPTFFSGLGYSRFTMVVLIVGAVSILIAGPVLVIWLGFGATGAIFAILISNVISTALGLILALRYLHARLTIPPLLGIVGAGMVGLLALYFASHAALPEIPLLILEILVFMFAYLTLVPLFGGIGFDDLNRLRASIDRIRFIGPIMDLVLAYERLVLVKTRASH